MNLSIRLHQIIVSSETFDTSPPKDINWYFICGLCDFCVFVFDWTL